MGGVLKRPQRASSGRLAREAAAELVTGPASDTRLEHLVHARPLLGCERHRVSVSKFPPATHGQVADVKDDGEGQASAAAHARERASGMQNGHLTLGAIFGTRSVQGALQL